MMSEEQLRSFFPFIKTGRIYLNHAATSPLSTYVTANIQKQMEIRSRGVIENYVDTVALVEETRALVPDMLHASPERIAFVQNTSDGINILASGIEWNTGDRILLNDVEFPANVYPFLNQKKHGVEIDFIHADNGVISTEQIINAITPHTRLLSISWVQFLSGVRCDLKMLGDICRERGIIFCVDAIQGLGALQLDLEATPVDFLSCGAQKWLMSPHGIGFVYLSEEMQARIQQSNVGWLAVNNAWDFLDYKLDLLPSAQRYEGGTKNVFGIAGFNGALQLFREFGWERVEERVLSNTSHLYKRLSEEGFDVVTPSAETMRAGIVSFAHPRSEEIFLDLKEQNIDVSHRLGAIRISPHFYNTHEEIDIAVNMMLSFLSG